jgi:hypothetical protein
MISDDEIERALDYLRDHAEDAAQAKANKIYLTEYRKVKKAELMRRSNHEAVNAQEVYAYAHSEYQEFLAGLREAVYQDAKHDFLREAANAKIEAWRTEQANQRTMGKIV